MPRGTTIGQRDPLRGTVEGSSGEGGGFRLLRQSHIFASAVREVLESELLGEVSPLPLTISQFHLLRLMYLNGQHQVGEVAEFLGVSPPAATKNIDKLERLGLVVRTRSRGDRRATLLSLTPGTRRLMRKYEALQEARLKPVIRAFRPEEIEQLSELLERFALALLEYGDPSDRICLRCAAYIENGCPVSRIRGDCPYQRLGASKVRATTAKETP